MKILIINAGSSSLKYQLIDMTDESVIAKGLVERIGIEGSRLTHKYADKKYEVVTPLKDHVDAMQLVISALTDKEHGVIRSMDEIGAVGHRVVHGGEKFAASQRIDEKMLAAVEENVPLAPLHNPANLQGIHACQAVMPNTPMVGVFDTAFHQTMPPEAFLYGLPMDYYRRLKVRRYGFHGTSHRFVSQRAAELAPVKKEDLKLIVCHLGNGSSLSAVKGGKSIDTSMGMTPLDGVLMGTRSGSIDPAILEYVMQQDNLDIQQMTAVLNKKSGLEGLSGVSSDMRDINAAADSGNADARTALNMWAYGVKKYIGAYAAAMGGLDMIAFTAGIGENDAAGRAAVCAGLEFLGVKLDLEKNKKTRSVEAEISAPDSRVKVWVIPTNEELAIARDTLEIVQK